MSGRCGQLVAAAQAGAVSSVCGAATGPPGLGWEGEKLGGAEGSLTLARPQGGMGGLGHAGGGWGGEARGQRPAGRQGWRTLILRQEGLLRRQERGESRWDQVLKTALRGRGQDEAL